MRPKSFRLVEKAASPRAPLTKSSPMFSVAPSFVTAQATYDVTLPPKRRAGFILFHESATRVRPPSILSSHSSVAAPEGRGRCRRRGRRRVVALGEGLDGVEE